MAELNHLAADLGTLDTLENYQGWIFEEICPFLGRRLVEIGAGIGTFTQVLLKAHLKTDPSARLEVFEPNATLYRRLCERMHDEHAALLQAGRLVLYQEEFRPSPARPDTVIMINALEHIQDDRGTIRAVYQSLEPGGALVVYTPALSWLYSNHDKVVGHFRRYENTPLTRLFREEGFTVVKAHYMDCMGVIPWYVLNVLGGSQSINPHLARLYDRWFVPAAKWIEGLITPPAGKNILMVGRKSVPAPP